MISLTKKIFLIISKYAYFTKIWEKNLLFIFKTRIYFLLKKYYKIEETTLYNKQIEFVLI